MTGGLRENARPVNDPAASDGRYDVVIDIGGMTPVSRLRRLLTRDGTLVIVGGENGGDVGEHLL